MNAPVIFVGTGTDDGRIVYELPSKIRSAHVAKRFPGVVVEVEIREFQTKRTARQNRALWALLNAWAREGGHSPDDLKDDVMGEVFGWNETPSPITHRVTPKRPSTSSLNVADFCHLIEEILRIAAECGVWLESPAEYRKAKEAAAKHAERDRKKAEKGRAA